MFVNVCTCVNLLFFLCCENKQALCSRTIAVQCKHQWGLSVFSHRPCRSRLRPDLRGDVELPALSVRRRPPGDGASKRHPSGNRDIAVGGEDWGGDALRLNKHLKKRKLDGGEKKLRKWKAFLKFYFILHFHFIEAKDLIVTATWNLLTADKWK